MISELHNVIISSIKRNDRNGNAEAITKNETDIATLSDNVEEKLTSIFKGSGILVGDFSVDDENGKPLSFEKNLNKFIHLDGDFSIKTPNLFAEKVSKLLAAKLNSKQGKIANDGFLVTYLYSETDIDEDEDEDEDNLEQKFYLCLIFLHRISGTDIDEDELIFEEIERVNLDSLNLGAKISLNDWAEDEDRVLSFKLGKGTGAVREYFKEFLGCSETKDHVEDTNALKAAIEEICKEKGITTEQSNEMLHQVRLYCLDRINNHSDQKVSLDVISKMLFPKAENADTADRFMQIALDNYRLGDEITLDKTTLRSFAKFYGETKDYRVSFKREALTNGNVEFNKKSKTLTFKNLPDDLIQELNKR
ncbi:nucleoid-associated protein [Pseudoalteromonas sp. SG44-17]|uniref:nucleoid-associated protein n=1 Tax=Pseudoalteromonas sp. SG44-17 TaxID=2760963 RepID=UPI0015FF96BB|nr:nucleoid-associated protein [Pseudoalteromonas sp. SG44-17]MBB1409172.1 nucleoid-associated protein [Pseudoalteromonas sp. SG44-17]